MVDEDVNECGCIEDDKPIEELRREPYTLPQGFVWDTLDISDEKVVCKTLFLHLLVVHNVLKIIIGSVHDLVTWYKITHAGERVAQWDFQSNATSTIPPGPAFVLEVPLCNLLTSMCDFAPCDRILQRAYYVNKLLIWL